MKRRGFVAGVLVASTLGSTAQAKQGEVMLIYVGGWDCPPCLAWKNKVKPGFLASSEFKKIQYVEIEAPKLKEAYQDRYWPEQYRPIRDQLRRKSGTPRFVVVQDGKVTLNELGSWKRTWARLQSLVG